MTRRGAGSERPEKPLSLHLSPTLCTHTAYDNQNNENNKENQHALAKRKT